MSSSIVTDVLSFGQRGLVREVAGEHPGWAAGNSLVALLAWLSAATVQDTVAVLVACYATIMGGLSMVAAVRSSARRKQAQLDREDQQAAFRDQLERQRLAFEQLLELRQKEEQANAKSLHQHIDILQGQHSELQAQNVEQLTDLKKLRVTSHRTAESLQSLTSERDDLRDQLAAARREVAQLTDQVLSLAPRLTPDGLTPPLPEVPS